MKKILLFGAGRSTSALIDYLQSNRDKENWHLTIAEKFLESIDKSLVDSKTELISLNISEETKRKNLVSNADIVISMLPARMHIDIVKDCIQYKKSMVTASYVSDELKALEREVEESGITILNEVGVDPGIDHISAKKLMDDLVEKGAEIEEFETFTGGLVAPQSDNNPWSYKFTWNPRNVVVAGQGGAVKFIQEGTYKYIPYHKLFRRTEIIEIDNYGKFEGIANRDSLKYRSIYGLENIKTMYRGTLRRPGFCRAWDAFVQLGATDDSFIIENSKDLTYREFINLFLPYNPNDSVELKLRHYLNLAQDEVELFDKLKWLDIFEEIPVNLDRATPAQILQSILERKWKLEPDDRDMIVMWHRFSYKLNGVSKEVHSSMVIEGDANHTAMSKTVGLPVGISTKLLLNGTIKQKGIRIPIHPEIYLPLYSELEEHGINFIEKEIN